MTWELRIYLLRLAVLDDVDRRLRAAQVAGDLYGQGVELAERAWVQMHLRDMWTHGSERWCAWNGWMRRDVARAAALRTQLRAA